MRHHSSNSPQRIQALRVCAVVAVSLVLLLIYAGCGPQQQQTGADNKGTYPSPSPEQILELSDTPIVISGGSVHLELNNGTFKPCTGSTPPTPPCPSPTVAANTMYWAPGKISGGSYYDDNENTPDTGYPITVTASTTIKIMCSGGGNSGDIIIKNDSAANRVYVEFDESAKFKALHPGAFRRVSKKFKVDRLVTENPAKDYSTESTWPANKKVIIELTGAP